MMYSSYMFNKHGDNIQPWHIPFPILNQTVVACPVLILASWPAYRYLRRQVKWLGISISLNMISVQFQGELFNIIVVEVYAPTTNAQEGEVEQFYENL